MKHSIIVVLSVCTLFFGCTRQPLSQRMVESEMRRCPTAADLDGMAGKLKWNYTPGLEMLSFLDAAYPSAVACGKTMQVPGSPCGTRTCPSFFAEGVLGYVDTWYDAIIREDGSVGANYKRSNYNVDHICPGRTLFKLYDLTGKQKYRAAIDSIYQQVKTQPRTEAGAFWHKKIYPYQVWLDGFYMAQPFYAQYSARYMDSEAAEANFSDIARQFAVAYDKCMDPATGLLRHAWDETRSMFWADPATGQSAHAWGRAMGWYLMALVDVLDWMSDNHPDREGLVSILRTLLDRLQEYDDPATGMWYQVLDCPGREGNYIESTCSAMFTYVYLKAAAKGYAPEYGKYARRLYRKLVKTFIREETDGTITLTECCAVAGLGGKENRSGDYDYYIHEKKCENDPKGVGPFIWASLYNENRI